MTPSHAAAAATQHRRILHVIEPAAFGGAETVASALARGAAGRGHAVHVVALRQSEGDNAFIHGLRDSGVEITVVHCGRRRYLREVSRLADVLRRWRPTVVHTHGYHGDLVGSLAARRVGIPVVATAHGFTGGGVRNRLYEWLDKRALRNASAVACVSQRLVEDLRAAGVPESRVHLVPNGHDGSVAASRIEARRILGVDGERGTVGWVGRLSPEKAPARFARVMAEVPDARGVIVGDGPERQSVQELIDRTHVDIRMTGPKENAGRLVRAFDVLAITSRTEGLPMILLDAMAAGVPVVATAVGALPQALGGDAGWLVAEPDEGAFASALREALARPDESARRAERARDRLTRTYSLSAWLDRMDDVYERVSA